MNNTKYVRIPVNLINETFFEVLSSKNTQPEIINSYMEAKPRNTLEYRNVDGKGYCKVYWVYIPAKKNESNEDLIQRGIKEAKECVACQQYKFFGRGRLNDGNK